MVRGILIRLIVVAGLPIAFLRPFSGLLLYLWYSHARPNDFVWPGYSFDSGAMLIAVATLLGYFCFEMQRSPLRWRGLILVTFFWVWIALATAFATDPSLALPKLSQYTNIFVITFLIAAMANSEERIRTVLYVIAISVGILGAKAALDFVLTGGRYQAHGPGGLMHEENEFALALNMAIPLLFGLSKLQTRRWLRLCLLGMMVGCMITVVATYSRSGFLGMACAALLLTLYSRRKMLGIAGLALAALVLLVYAPSKAIQRYGTISTAAEEDPSAIGRLQAWQTALRMMQAHPMFGIGPLNFVETFSQYSSFTPRAPHNAFMALGAESGIPSALLFCGIVGGAIFEMWSVRRKLQGHAALMSLASYCLMIQMALIVYIVPNLFINRQNQDMMYHLVGISVGLAVVAKRRLAEESVKSEEAYAPELMAVQPAAL